MEKMNLDEMKELVLNYVKNEYLDEEEIDLNYWQIKQDVLDIVKEELERIK